MSGVGGDNDDAQGPAWSQYGKERRRRECNTAAPFPQEPVLKQPPQRVLMDIIASSEHANILMSFDVIRAFERCRDKVKAYSLLGGRVLTPVSNLFNRK